MGGALPTNNTSKLSSALGNLAPNDSVEKERMKESQYRDLFTDLLKKHKGLAGIDEEVENPSHYAAEAAILKGAVRSEREAWICGLVVGIAAFASFRYFPTYIVKAVGGEKKAKALREAEEASRKAKYGTLRRTAGFLFEASFGFWAGRRGYQMASARSEGTYAEIARIPLCEGRSALAEGLCSQWVDLAHRRVPNAFWKNLDDGNLTDNKTWRAIWKFSENCMKREAYEKGLRRELGLGPNDPVLVPHPGVPDNFSADTEPLSKEAAERFVTDECHDR